MITSDTFAALRALIGREEVVVSEHGYDELANDGLFAREIVEGFVGAVVIEDYPEYSKGPCILTLQRDREGRPIHVVLRDTEGQNVAGRGGGLPAQPRPLEGRFQGGKKMKKKRYSKLVQESGYVAEVELDLIESDEGWSPYLSLDDAYKLDDVRDALRL